MTDQAEGQVSTSAAEVYETFFVPALFGQWGERMAAAAGLKRGDRVLDVAGAPGGAARAALPMVAPAGAVIGLDRNDGMLAVARRIEPAILWRNGRAEDLPFEDAAFDAVLSQFGLMFFEVRVRALAEMWRVLSPGGGLAVAVWDSLSTTPGYAAMVDLLEHLFGSEVAAGLRAPFVLGETGPLLALFEAAGIEGAEVATIRGEARFPSIEAWVHTDIKGWTLADMIDDEQYATLQREAACALQAFVDAEGRVRFAAPAHVVTARKV
jgi:SAM-dependent methyltransferase